MENNKGIRRFYPCPHCHQMITWTKLKSGRKIPIERGVVTITPECCNREQSKYSIVDGKGFYWKGGNYIRGMDMSGGMFTKTGFIVHRGRCVVDRQREIKRKQHEQQKEKARLDDIALKQAKSIELQNKKDKADLNKKKQPNQISFDLAQ